MKRVSVYLIIFILCSFIFVPIVRAEDEENQSTCDSIKLRDLKKQAENVTGTSEFVYNNDNQVIGFNYVIYNIPDDMYVSYTGMKSQKVDTLEISENVVVDPETGIGKVFDDNLTDIYSVVFTVYQKSAECVDKLYTFSIKKLRYNSYSELELCQYEGLEDYIYCQPWVDTEFPYSSEEVKKRIESKIKNEQEKTKSECVSCSENQKNEEEYNKLVMIRSIVIFGLISGIIIDLVVIINLFRKVGENRI
jgi:hypothetical protein